MAESLLIERDQEDFSADDAALVRAAQLSLENFKPLYQKWLAPVYRYFHYRVGNAKDAEDLTSQVFLKVYEELPRYRDHGQFSAWLFTIVRHQAADFYRAHKATLPLDALEAPDPGCDVLAQTVRTDEIERLQRLIRALPEADQELIRLRFVVELGYREIGTLLDRKEDAVRKSLARLLARLQSHLEESHA